MIIVDFLVVPKLCFNLIEILSFIHYSYSVLIQTTYLDVCHSVVVQV